MTTDTAEIPDTDTTADEPPGCTPMPDTGRITRRALAAFLHVSPRTVFEWVRHGIYGQKLRCEMVGKYMWFKWSDVREWQERVRVTRFGPDEPEKPAKKSAKATKTSSAAKDALDRNGYTKDQPAGDCAPLA